MRLTNWNKTEESHPVKIFRPKSEQELSRILKDAHEKKKQVRVVGPSRHTWGKISMSDDYVIEMKHFTKLVAIDAKRKQVTVQAGTILHKLFRTLAKHGLSVNNMGGIDAQTIAGVVNTGTHGSSVYHGTFSDDVIGMRVMLANGKILKLTKKHPYFPAFQVGLGSLGIVLDITLQCTELFYVKSKTKMSKIDWAALASPKLLPILKKHHFPQMVVDPFSQQVVLYQRDKVHSKKLSDFTRKVSLPTKAAAQVVKEVLGVTLTEYIVLPFAPLLGARTKKLISMSTELAREDFTDLSYRALTIGGNDLKGVYLNKTFHDQEYAVDIKNTAKALKKVLALSKKYKGIPLLIALRFVRGSKAWLSPSYGRMTCYIDVLIFAKDFSKWEPFVRDVEKSLYPLKARPHWGKHNYLTYTQVKKLYPRLEAFRKAKAKVDPSNLFGNRYLNDRLKPIS